MNAIGQIIELILWLFLILMLIRIVISWVQVLAPRWHPRGLAVLILETVFTVTDPPIKAIRRVLPPMRMGSMMLDLAPLLVMIACYLLLAINRAALLS